MGTKDKLLLERLFTDLTREDNPKRLGYALHDLFVRVNCEQGEVSLYGEEDELLGALTLFSWIKQGEHSLTDGMLTELREVITRLDAQGYWSGDSFLRPFSIELVDEAFKTQEVLLYRDEDVVQISRPLLEGLDEELNKFLVTLLGDLK